MAQMGVVHASGRNGQFRVMENRLLNSLALAQRDDNTSADCLTASLERMMVDDNGKLVMTDVRG